jgi:hypothetical protein
VSATGLIALAPSGLAGAAWTASGLGSSAGAAAVMPSGLAPSGSATSDFVALNWTAVTFADGEAVAGYVVSRYNAASGLPGTVNASCAGVVAGTSCTDSPVPAGSWVYTVTPVEQGWAGAESPDSAVVVVKLT